MAARGALERAAIDSSERLEGRRPTLLDAARPAVEEIDDLDWLCNESQAEMGEHSALAFALERASSECELAEVDESYMHGKKPGLYSGKTLTGGPWEERVDEPGTGSGDSSYRGDGYTRKVWAQMPKQSSFGLAGHFGERSVIATEMARNVTEVLRGVTARQRLVLTTQHLAKVHSEKMKRAFGSIASLAHLAPTVQRGYRAARERGDTLASIHVWLEGLCLRAAEGKSKKGELEILKTGKKEMTRELRAAYEAMREARAALPPGRKYPHRDRARHARRMSLIGGGT